MFYAPVALISDPGAIRPLDTFDGVDQLPVKFKPDFPPSDLPVYARVLDEIYVDAQSKSSSFAIGFSVSAVSENIALRTPSTARAMSRALRRIKFMTAWSMLEMS